MTAQTPIPFQSAAAPPEQVTFDRAELRLIMGLYGRMVAAGEWRDYALSFLREAAIFSAFRRASERPLYRIEKHPRLRGRQGIYALVGAEGQILLTRTPTRTPQHWPRPQAHSICGNGISCSNP